MKNLLKSRFEVHNENDDFNANYPNSRGLRKP